MGYDAPVQNNTHSAIVLAAGMGTRLGNLTHSVPKPLLPVNGTPIIFNALRCLAACGIKVVTIVIGHLGHQIRTKIGTKFGPMDISYVEAPKYQTTNNLISLWEARSALQNATVLLDGDVYFEEEVLRRVLNSPYENNIAVDKYVSGMTGTVSSCDSSGRILELQIVRTNDELASVQSFAVSKTLSIQRFSQQFLTTHFMPTAQNAINQGQETMFYENILAEIISGKNTDVYSVPCKGLRWTEIDDLADYAASQVMFVDRQLTGASVPLTRI